MPATITTKLDEGPLNPGELNVLVNVYDPNAGQRVSSSGAVIRLPGGVGSGMGAPPLPETPVWQEAVKMELYGINGRLDDGRPVAETWAKVTTWFMTTKLYRPGMILQVVSGAVAAGQVFEILGNNVVQMRWRKQYFTCKAVQ